MKTRWSIKTKIVIGFGTALLTLMSISIISYYSIFSLITTLTWVAHTHEVLQTLGELRADLLDAESAGHSYSMTGVELYLAPYHMAVASIDRDVEKLRSLTADNSNQQRRLDMLAPLVTQRIAAIDELVRIRRENGVKAAAQLIEQDQNWRLMADIRTVLGELVVPPIN